ncbi:MAG TPA: HNH endonuclease [Bryobacteraceae bacterium]|nr:HNH endonuclease [Bryobacteraceae bacterium]
MNELNSAIAGFIRIHQESIDPTLPPPDGAKALLKLRMAQLSTESLARQRYSRIILATVAALVIVIVFAIPRALEVRQHSVKNQIVPDPSLTPGATLPVTRNEVCSETSIETVRIVPASVARQVFASYGIHEPKPRAYELDYLITPALGGGDNIRNFWPQPYGAPVWNAHVKDALEDRLHRLVCSGELDLATAQRDIAQDWTAAYKKYFVTDRPLPEHSRFVKDRPWE